MRRSKERSVRKAEILVARYCPEFARADGRECFVHDDGRTQQVPPDPDSLREIAETSGGRFYTASDAGALEQVYEDLGSQIGTRPEQREITAGVAAAGVLLLFGALGTAWRRRGILA